MKKIGNDEIIETKFLENDKLNCYLNFLEFRDFEFYSRSIKISKDIYDSLSITYARIGQFTYFDKRDQGKEGGSIQGTEENPRCIRLFLKIKEKYECFREIRVHRHGEIWELEYNSNSDLCRCRKILADRSVVYQYISKTTGQVYGLMQNHFSGGFAERADMWESKSNGYLEVYYGNGDRLIGMDYAGVPYGNFRRIDKDENGKD